MCCRGGEGATGCACRRVLMFGVDLPHATPTGAWRMRGGAWSHTTWAGVVYPERCAYVRCTPTVLCSLSIDVEEQKEREF